MKKFSDEVFYTPEQVANTLQLSLTTVYNLIKSKELPSIRVGKCFRIPESELSRLFISRQPIVPQTVISLVDKLRKSKLSEKINDVILFGSYARGNPDEESDIDLLIIYKSLTASEKEKLLKLEDEAAEEAGYVDYMNVIKKSLLQWKSLEKEKAGLFKTVSKEGISLWEN